MHYSGIITSGGEVVREDEYSHKGIDRGAQIDKNLIESNEYRRKFDNATDNPKVNKVLYDLAKEMLFYRSGTRYESMRWIDGDTGEVIYKFDSMGNIPELTGADHELKVEYGENVLHKLSGHNNIIVIHNHPNSTAPSAGDFNSAIKHGYSAGFVVTHNGRVFKYTSNQQISDSVYDITWQKYHNRGYDEIEAQIMTLRQFMRDADITYEEVHR
jgi:proteasome lid subunit RPN8/RPN11